MLTTQDRRPYRSEPGVLDYLRNIAGDKAVDHQSAPTILSGRNVLNSRSSHIWFKRCFVRSICLPVLLFPQELAAQECIS